MAAFQIIVDVLALFGAVSLLGFGLMWYVILHTEDPAYQRNRRILDERLAEARQRQREADNIRELDRWENWTR